jgi:hypothetical protein
MPDESAAGDRFTATAPRLSIKTMTVVAYCAIAASITLPLALHAAAPELPKGVLFFSLLACGIAFAAFGLSISKNRRQLTIGVTAGGLLLEEKTGGVFEFGDMQLGPWIAPMYGSSLGTALHLCSGRRRFVVGGEYHRAPPRTRFDAPPVRTVDAQMSAADFQALLTRIGPACGLDVRAPAPDEPIRCLLLPNAARFFSTARFGITQQPRLAIDVGKDAIWVVDLATNALIASAWAAQVTVTPAMRIARARGQTTMPALIVQVPGCPSLTIGSPDPRFSWPRGVEEVGPPEYVVSGADWRTLVGKFAVTAAPIAGRGRRWTRRNLWGTVLAIGRSRRRGGR